MSYSFTDPEEFDSLTYKFDGEEEIEVEDAEAESDKASKEQDDDEEVSEEDSEESSEEEESEEFNEQQKGLLKMLLDPETRGSVIRALAEQEGIEFTSKKAAKKAIEDEIKELMGDELDQIPAKTWKAIDKLVERRVESLKENYDAQLNNLTASMIQKEAEEATERMREKYPDFNKFESRIQRLMKDVQPAENVPMFKHLKNLYFMAKGAGKGDEMTSEKTRRIKENSKEETLRSSSGKDDSKVKIGSGKKLSLEESIALATQGKKIKR